MDCKTINLKNGAKGEQVIELQIKLKKDKLYNGKIDGIFGQLTEKAVKILQLKNGNTQDGVFGPKTCSKSGYSTPIANSVPSMQNLGIIYCDSVDIKYGSSGSQVSLLQAKLINAGYNLSINAKCDFKTVKAIKSLQKKQGNTQDGVFGPKTCSKTKWFKLSKNKIKETSTEDSKILKVYVFDQEDIISCGPTSICMAFSYYDVVTPDNFYESKRKIMKLANTDQNGTTPENLAYSVNKFNKNFIMEQKAYDGMPILKKYIGNNIPCLAQINTTPSLGYKGVYGHYILISGYNVLDNTVRIVDPSRTSYGARFIPISWLTQAIKSRGHPTPIKPLIKK